MATSRDVSSPFDPNAPVTVNGVTQPAIAEFEGFAADVPNTDGMIRAVNSPLDPAVTRANVLRAARLFVPALVAGVDPDAIDFVGLPTPDRVNPTPGATFERRGLHDQAVDVPGLGPVTMWSFEAREQNGATSTETGFPAPIIRVREGDIVHSTLGSRTGPHTIHHHGIEPTAMNDGVGHLTFEVAGGTYTYQWLAGEAGTYFYHCHRNTVLHFEMGMYGALIIDPPEGPGFTMVGNTPTAYQKEAIWVADDIDTRWHGMTNNPGPNNRGPITHVASGIQATDNDGRTGFVRFNDTQNNPYLNDFNPNVFMVTGQAADFGADNAIIGGAGVTVVRGERLLVRTLNASYCTQRWQFPTLLPGQVTAADGRTFGREPFGRYSAPYTLASIDHRFLLTTARRFDVLIDTAAVPTGTHLVDIHFHHWITDVRLRTVRVPITVTA